MMARSANAPLKGRIQKRKTNNLQIITSGLQRTAGPYRCASFGRSRLMHICPRHCADRVAESAPKPDHLRRHPWEIRCDNLRLG
jgi:hypothetical protein